MGTLIDLTGMRFGSLVVIERAPGRPTPSGRNRTYWLCRCDCGNYKEVDGNSLRHGDAKSCGCMMRRPASYRGVEFIEKPKPKQVSIQDKMQIGETIQLYGKRLTLIEKYEHFGRFADQYGLKTCYGWWDLERKVKR